MASPTSPGIQGATFYENDNTELMWAVADQLTKDGVNPTVKKAFPPEVAPVFRYKVGLGYGVDPSDVEQFVQAWLRHGNARRLQFTPQNAMSAMTAAGLDASKASMVANAMMRLHNAGKLNYLGQNPSGWVSETGLAPLTGLKWFIAAAPWILGAAALWVALPYLKAARAPGLALGGDR